MIRITQKPLEVEARFNDAAIVAGMAHHEPAIGERRADRVRGCEALWIRRAHEPHERIFKSETVEFVGTIEAYAVTASGVPKVFPNVAVDRITRFAPACHRRRKRPLSREPQTAVHRHPAHQARMDMIGGSHASAVMLPITPCSEIGREIGDILLISTR